MKKFDANKADLNLVCSLGDKSPLRIYRINADKILDWERVHYHPNGFEFYLVLESALSTRVFTSGLH